MTTITLTGTYASGYFVSSPVTTLSIAAPGYVEGAGVQQSGAGAVTVFNSGRVTEHTGKSAIYLQGGGAVTNGAGNVPNASIEGQYYGVYLKASGDVTNLGAIATARQSQGAGVELHAGGVVQNGALTDANATLSGYDGVAASGTATVFNFGAITGSQETGVTISGAGYVDNGAATDRTALIQGFYGVQLGGAGKVQNFGVIRSLSQTQGAVYIQTAGGAVVNGSAQDQVALIVGEGGVQLNGAGLVHNYGTIIGEAASGVGDVTTLTNGFGAHSVALIEGRYGVDSDTTATVVDNYAVIDGTSSDGVALRMGGTVINGGNACRAALVEGSTGVEIEGGAGVVENSGTISGDSFGVVMLAGLTLTNGSLNNSTALIEGVVGAELRGAGDLGGVTATNFGAIVGLGDTGGFGVTIGTHSLLTNGAAGHTTALIEGYSGVLVAGGGPGTTVTNFGSIVGAAGVAVQFGTPNDVLAVEAGSTFIGAVNGDGGTLDLASGTGTIANLFGAEGVTVSGSMAPTTFSNFDTVEIAAGAAFTDADAATTIAAADTLIDNGALALSGAVANAGQIEMNAANLTVGAAGLTLTGAGSVAMGASPGSQITGATAAASLTLGQMLTGGGSLGAGQLSLTIAAAGEVESTGANALVIDTGANTIANAGRIVADTAGIAIDSAVNNSGLLWAYDQTLTVAGAVTGTGHAQINVGTLNIAATASFNQNVFFVGALGTLELADSQGYSGRINGFSLTGLSTLDLEDIAYAAVTTTATYSGTASSGVLTVTDGTHTAQIHFNGNYTASTWTLSSDGHGGTDIVDPAKPAPAATPPRPANPILPTHTFVQAMAGMETAPHATSSHTAEDWRQAAHTLIAPRSCAA